MTKDPLLSAALLGAARMTALPAAPDPALEPAWQAIDPAPPAAALLQALALTRALERAGARTAAVGAEETSAPCPPETRPEVTPAAVDAIQRLLRGEFAEVLPEWLRLATAAGRVAPPRLLPELLGKATRDRALRPAIRAIAGERGLWIARRRPEYAWLLEDAAVAEEAWEEGQPAERIAWLRQTRPRDPEQAAAAIVAQWPGEDGPMRESILRVIAAAPAACDEEWLEPLALKDRRQEVRELAATALAALPGSALRARAQARVRNCVKLERRLLKRVLAIVPPVAFEPAWAADGLKEKPPQGTGEKAWWLRQAVALVPLADWPELLGCAAEDLFKLPVDGDWREPLLLGWIDSARRFPAAALAEGLVPFLAALDPWPAAATMPSVLLPQLLDVLPPGPRFAVLDAIAAQLPQPLALELFARGGEAPPAGTGQAMLAVLDAALLTMPTAFGRHLARSLAVCIPPAGIQRRLEALAGLPELSPAAEDFATTLEFRRALLPHFEKSPSLIL